MICLQIALACGFLFVVGTGLMFNNIAVAGKKICKLSLIVMDDLHWLRVPGEPGMLKKGSNVITKFFEDLCNFNKVSSGVNAGEGKELHNTMWC